jgi:hypothetical protein
VGPGTGTGVGPGVGTGVGPGDGAGVGAGVGSEGVLTFSTDVQLVEATLLLMEFFEVALKALLHEPQIVPYITLVLPLMCWALQM